MKNSKKVFLKCFKIIIYLLLFFVLTASIFISKRFEGISFEQLLYNIVYPKGANFDIVFQGLYFVLKMLVVVLFIICLIYFFYKKFKIKQWVDTNVKLINKFNLIIILFFAFISIYSLVKSLGLDIYIKSQKQNSNLFEEYYVNGEEIKLSFPKKKRNLIYIFAESMESTNVSTKNGGAFKKSYIPKLEKLALENINFSNTDKIGGAYQINNTEWTIAALISQTSGTPIKLSMKDVINKTYNVKLPGVYSLGDVLKDNGYNNYFMIGSDADFGGRKEYFEYHGNYKVYDYYYAIDKELIDPNYFVWWGYEDQKLFNYAKDKIKEISKQDEPFNFTILTVDTHFTDGYMDDSCEEIFDSKYANSLYCSDSKIYNFIKWLKKQDFYEDTTIIISGDHLSLQHNFYNNEDYIRTTYNTFINSAVEPINEKNREFSSFDMFPSTLAAMGVKIEGNKLGLGVNLFSDEETLIEKLGYDTFNNEISKKSNYYNEELIKNKKH